jgi:Kef-type K+ transport system membrane component KefB/nucleotide-binding universal stress UspA family protein
MAHGASVAVFIAQLVVLLVGGRLMGELMQRLGQPSVIGQIIAGVLLGPSVLGALAPGAWHALFPAVAQQQAMLDAVAQLGILLLLLITGMETNLSVFRDAQRPAISVSLSGVIVPFLCGCLLGALLPAAMLPNAQRRLVTTLFLGTALSISSVKIVALVVRDLGFLRRTVGQVILAAAVLDDTIGWIVVSVTFGLALHGAIDLAAVAHSVLGAALFLALSLTVGRRLVFNVLRWSNDTLASEMANITTIVVITGFLALLTNVLGVHFVLGAFIAGLLVGQSPMLTRQLGAQLRGLIIGLFMPAFFTLVGLRVDIGALAQPAFLWLTLVLIALASVGKFLGAFIGGRFGGMTPAASFAVGCGMNARGSTEVIVATIGLQVGALNPHLFTAIVAMAVVTTMAMPPMLRWAFSRVPLTEAERTRLEREDFEARAFLPGIDRLLLAVDGSPSGRFASQLAGWLAATRRTPITVMQLEMSRAGAAGDSPRQQASEVVQAAAAAGAAASAAGRPGSRAAAAAHSEPVPVTTRSETAVDTHSAIATEAHKGYGLLLIGCEPAASAETFAPEITRTVADFPGAFGIAIARGAHRRPPAGPLHMLVTVSGTRASRQGAEVAITLAQSARGSVTALHVGAPRWRAPRWRLRFGEAFVPRGYADAVVREIIEMGEHYGVEVRGEIRSSGTLRNAVMRELTRAHYDLLVMGVSPRAAEPLFLGELAAEMLLRADFASFHLRRAAPAPDRVGLGGSQLAGPPSVVPRCRLAASQTVAG